MKDKLKYRFEIYKQSLTNQKFMMSFLLSILFSAYGVALAFNWDYISGFLNILSGGIYIAGFLLIILINTCNVYYIFEDNQFYIIRFFSKKKYLCELIKTIVFSNFFMILLNIILIMIGLNVFNSNRIDLVVKQYEIPGYIYLLFSIIKLFTLSISLSIINILLLKLIDKRILILLNIVLCVLIAGTPIYATTISSITQFPWFIGTYFLGYVFNYSSFIFEILCFSLYVSLLIVFIIVLKYITLKYMKEISR